MHKKLVARFHRRPYRYGALLGCIVLLLSLTANHTLSLRTLPNTSIGSMSLSGKSKDEVDRALMQLVTQPVAIRVKTRVYPYVLSHLGITLDIPRTRAIIFQKNTEPFPMPLISFMKALMVPERFTPALVFSPRFDTFVQSSVFAVGNWSNQVQVDSDTKQVQFIERDERYNIHKSSLKSLLATAVGGTTPIEPELLPVSDPAKEEMQVVNAKIQKAIGTPLYITAVASGSASMITLTPHEMKTMLSLTISPKSSEPIYDVPAELAAQIVNSHLLAQYPKVVRRVSPETAKARVLGAMTARINQDNFEPITMALDDGPNTAGNRAPKYIEIDISQQKMYLFHNEQLYKAYPISSGLYYPTPTGEFTILNKATNAFSDIYNVWMPYWMAFGYSSELNAFFGIHELPYWVADDGKKIQRPRERIGNPSTGGCVALDVGQAKEVYAFADIGTPVIIFD